MSEATASSACVNPPRGWLWEDRASERGGSCTRILRDGSTVGRWSQRYTSRHPYYYAAEVPPHHHNTHRFGSNKCCKVFFANLKMGFCSCTTKIVLFLFNFVFVKEFLGGKRFSDDGKVKETVEKWLSEVELGVFDDGIKKDVARAEEVHRI
ncbi:hypothetical protein AAG570_010066 [Ranatra chinensis]|uniref:Uncharacterized protein n=1 Tax=Ranatra chinensis TaxID=642074 RepID=A0ABD0YLG4_9HEMI